MLNLHEIESAIKELENGSATYNNCMKLASLYIIRDEMRKKEDMYNYTSYGYGGHYYPMYERGNNGSGNSGSSSYGYREPMFYENDDLMIRKDGMSDYRRM